MLGLSLHEALVLLVAVILFVRPEDLPRFVRTIGKFYGKVQQYVYEARASTRSTLREIQELDRQAKDAIKGATSPFKDAFVSPTPFHDEKHDYCESADDYCDEDDGHEEYYRDEDYSDLGEDHEADDAPADDPSALKAEICTDPEPPAVDEPASADHEDTPPA
jgi:Sec-independent protein translocase protein TatA